ncbi:MAG: AAA family ATPase [Anaerovoracaceae bacterium]
MERHNVVDLLEYIDPRDLSYEEWLHVGMGLKEEGCTAADWENWSRRDVGRYHDGECFKKWNGFHGMAGTKVTAGTVVQMAKDHGWKPDPGTELDWDSEISKDSLKVVDHAWLEAKEVAEPNHWNPVQDLTTYLEILFEAGENVGYVTSSWEKDGKYLPNKGDWSRTSGQLIEALSKCGGDIGAVMGDYKKEAGAWIRFNPLDGKGCKNENVTEFRYALVESDSMEIEKQNAIIRELELPVACLVHSGKKSLHAIVRVDAADYGEYRKRVDYLYEVCKKNGMEIDTQNRNPSRLSRMPGIMRNGRRQFLVDTNIGKENWTQWHEWIEGVNDDLPEPESLTDTWEHLPELSPPLIEGILRQGHKLLLAGPSKAGKSYALIEMCIALAEGKKWLQWKCTKGKVLYVNLELDRASCLHRFKDVYQALKIEPAGIGNIDIWNLRGRSVPMDKLAPKLIRRAAKKDYIAIIIDPIYKVITGDENSADQMAHFCNQFDLVCTELGCAVVYCHHHSKGGQGNKRSMDRASGSGVFARDPDALLDLIELEVSEELEKQKVNEAICQLAMNRLEQHCPDWEDHVSQDDCCSSVQMKNACLRLLSDEAYKVFDLDARIAEKMVQQLTAWRIEGTLREFPKFQPMNLWFDYPAHLPDYSGVLKDVDPEGESQGWQKNFKQKKTPEDRKKERKESLETAYEACGIDEKVTVNAIAEYMGVTEKTVRNRLKDHGGFWIYDGNVGKK